MSLVNFFGNDPFFSEFDRLFDEAFTRRTAGANTQVQRQLANTAPRALIPRYAHFVYTLVWKLQAHFLF